MFLTLDYFLVIKSITCTKDCIRVWMIGNDLNNLKWLYSVTNRFLIECLKNYGQKFVTLYRRQWSKTSTRKMNGKGKMVVWGGLKNSWEKKRSKCKEEKERYAYLNVVFQRIARRDKKAFLIDQCKEIEENNRTGKTRDPFKKIRDTKGNFHAKLDTIKDRNGMALTEVEDIKKRWHEYTEDQIIMTQVTTMVWSLTLRQTSWNAKSIGP